MIQYTSCGAGKMLAVGVDGKLYPCMRYCAYSLNEKEEYVIGNVDDGIDFDKVRPFQAVTYKLQSDSECLKCPVAKGCSFCQGFNYDAADTATNFQRAKYICKMHKARVRANNYYFAKLYNKYGIKRQNYMNEQMTMNFLLTRDFVSCCTQSNKSTANFSEIVMEKDMILDGLRYAEEHFFKPVFIHSYYNDTFISYDEFENYRILHIVPFKYYKKAKQVYKDVLPVMNIDDIDETALEEDLDNIILNIKKEYIDRMSMVISLLWEKVSRFNINILDLDDSFDLGKYENELHKVKELVVNDINSCQVLRKEINVLTDILFLKEHANCGAGEKNITFAPDGNLYVCPAFYSDETELPIGNLKDGLVNMKNAHLYTQEYAPLCNVCDAYHCANCIYHNKKKTKEVNVSSAIQCKKAHIERRVARLIQEECNNLISFPNRIAGDDCVDPIKKVIDKLDNSKLGFYPL